MAVNIVDHLNAELNKTTGEKIAMLDHFVADHGWIDEATHGTKKSFMNQNVNNYIARSINGHRKQLAEAAATYDEFTMD